MERFFREESGNVAILFALTLVPLALAVGAVIDYGRIAIAHSRLQHATDAAALAAANAAKANAQMTDAQAKTLAQNYVASNGANQTAMVNAATISSDRTGVCVNSQVQLPTTIMKIARVDTMTAKATACANLPANNTDTYEVALVLDNSGSMSQSAGGVSKIKAVQDAATNFVSTLFTKAPNRVWFSLVPFTASVVAVDPLMFDRTSWWADPDGRSPLHWNVFGGSKTGIFKSRFDIFAKLKAVYGSWDWGGCFEPLAYPQNVNDTSASNSDVNTLLVPMLAPDEPDGYYTSYYNDYLADGPSSSCPAPSDDWSKINNICKYAKATANYGWSYGPNISCPDYNTQKLLQLTSTQSSVNNAIKAMSANGDTNLHEGFMWGWRSVSPNQTAVLSAGKQPLAYNTTTNHKVIVMMTDGVNNWVNARGTVTGSMYEALGYYSLNGGVNPRLPDGSSGDRVNYQSQLAAAKNSYSSYLPTARKAVDELTLEACANAKALGIEVYTIGFSVPAAPIDAQGLNVLQTCASNSAHYFPATNVSDLNAAFSQIGAGLGKLHLSQ